MNKLSKLALALGVASVSSAAAAVNVTINYVDPSNGNTPGQLTYSASGMVISDADGIVINGVSANLSNGLQCGENTDEENGVCVGTGGGSPANPGDYCDTASGLYYDPIEELCVIPDSTPPALAISVNPSQLGNNETSATVTFTFNEPVEQFVASDVSVSNGSISGLAMQSTSPSKEVWTANFTRSGNDDGRASLNVAANRYQDAFGNANTQSSSASIILTGPAPSCAPRYSAATVHTEAPLFYLDRYSSQTPMDLSRSDVHAYPFLTGSNTSFNGQFGIVYFSNTGTVEKDIWISECAGGEPINGAPFSGVCEKRSKQTTLFWEQGGNTSWRCTMQPNTSYFLNVRNVPGSCSNSTGCDAKVQNSPTGSYN